MIIVDTSVWVDRLHRPDATLDMHIRRRTAMMHPMALGELACGMFSRREWRFGVWKALPRAPLHDHDEVIDWIESERLMGQGIGFIDAHLLYSALRRPGTTLWTRDKRLEALARPTTARLLRHWRSQKSSGIRPFFCQVEAAETAIWLAEVARGVVRRRSWLTRSPTAQKEAMSGSPQQIREHRWPPVRLPAPLRLGRRGPAMPSVRAPGRIAESLRYRPVGSCG